MLPGLAQLDVRGFDLQRLQNGHVILGAEHCAMVGDDALRAPRGGQGGKEPWQERGQSVMFGGHPCQHHACVAFQNTEAVEPVAVELDEIPHIDQPELVPRVRAIR